MARNTHLITVGDEQSQFARSLPNFSAFVQECLRMYANGEIEIDMAKLNLRKREVQRLEYETAIEMRLTKIEEILINLEKK